MNAEPSLQKAWDWRAALQFISGGTGAGLMFFSALAAFSDPAWLLRTGLAALALVGLGLFFVWIKLGRRLRFLYVFLNPRTSWMSREALFSIAFMLLAGGGVLLASPALAFAGSLSGLGYLYSQAQMLRTSRGIPAWREARTVPLMVLTGLVEGASLLAIAGWIFNAAQVWPAVTLFVLVAARFAAWVRYRQKILSPGAVPVRAAAALEQIRPNFELAGHLSPALLLLAAVLLPSALPVLSAFAGALALAGGWVLKFTLITRAAFDQGSALSHVPARTPGYGGGNVKPGWTDDGREDALGPAPQGAFVHAAKPAEHARSVPEGPPP